MPVAGAKDVRRTYVKGEPVNSFWDFFWFIISFFLLMAYLMVLFQIIGDLFRDKDVSGGIKAVWVFFLIFLPILTSLVYLVAPARGWPSATSRPPTPHGRTRRPTSARSRAAAPRRGDEISGPRACSTPVPSRRRSSTGLKAKALA